MKYKILYLKEKDSSDNASIRIRAELPKIAGSVFTNKNSNQFIVEYREVLFAYLKGDEASLVPMQDLLRATYLFNTQYSLPEDPLSEFIKKIGLVEFLNDAFQVVTKVQLIAIHDQVSKNVGTSIYINNTYLNYFNELWTYGRILKIDEFFEEYDKESCVKFMHWIHPFMLPVYLLNPRVNGGKYKKQLPKGMLNYAATCMAEQLTDIECPISADNMVMTIYQKKFGKQYYQ